MKEIDEIKKNQKECKIPVKILENIAMHNKEDIKKKIIADLIAEKEGKKDKIVSGLSPTRKDVIFKLNFIFICENYRLRI